MKELQNITQDQTELHAIKPAKTEHKFLGTIKKHPGHRLWELDLKTRRITEAEYESGDANFENAVKGDYSVRGKLVTKPGHLYCSALNALSADKKFFKLLGLKYPNKQQKLKTV